MVNSTRYVSITLQLALVLLSAAVAQAAWAPKAYTAESSAVLNSIPYRQAKGPDKELVKQLLPVQLQLRQIDERMYDVRVTPEDEKQMN